MFKQMTAIALGLGLATGAFAQDTRFIEYDEIDECGDVIGGGEWRPKTKGDSRQLDAIEYQIDLAIESLVECDTDIACEGGGHDELLTGACYRLKALLGSKERKINLQLYSVVEMVCSEGGGGGGQCGGDAQPDNAASTRAILIHGGYVLHDTQGQEEFNEQSP